MVGQEPQRPRSFSTGQLLAGSSRRRVNRRHKEEELAALAGLGIEANLGTFISHSLVIISGYGVIAISSYRLLRLYDLFLIYCRGTRLREDRHAGLGTSTQINFRFFSYNYVRSGLSGPMLFFPRLKVSCSAAR